jgi:hypothetical protein
MISLFGKGGAKMYSISFRTKQTQNVKRKRKRKRNGHKERPLLTLANETQTERKRNANKTQTECKRNANGMQTNANEMLKRSI